MLSLVTYAKAYSECSISQVEIDFASAMNKLTSNPFWGKYPSDTTFAVDDLDTSSPGYYTVPNEQEGQRLVGLNLAEICNGQPTLVRFIPSTEALTPDFYSGCSSESNEEGCRGVVKNYYAKTKKNIGLEIIDRKRTSRIFSSFNFKNTLNEVQLAINTSSHEMFHEYQIVSTGFTDKLPIQHQDYNDSYDECLTSPNWANQYKKERKWWQNKLPELLSKDTNRERLIAMAIEFTGNIRQTNASNELCNKALSSFELHEGIAHFIGNIALLRSEVITAEKLAEYDSQFFDLSPDLHSVGYVYGSGGAVSMLCERLMGSGWHQAAEAGKSPYDILKEYLSKSEND